jgi:hypothetical protein
VRATFYHLIAVIFLATTALWAVGLVSAAWSFYISATLFVVDYIAEMYDPHPDSPGPWFKAHFHRFLHDDEEFADDDSPGWWAWLKEGLAKRPVFDIHIP